MQDQKLLFKNKDLIYLFNKEESLQETIKEYCIKKNIIIETRYLIGDSDLYTLEIRIIS
jgi:hypothetical protein